MKRLVIGVDEAKTTFSRLVREVAAGNEVVIENHGKPVAKLIAYAPAPSPRQPGMVAGQIAIKPGFDEILQDFEVLGS